MKFVIFDLYGTLMNIHTDEEKESFWIHLANAFKKYKEYDPSILKEEYLNLCMDKPSDWPTTTGRRTGSG